VVEVGKTRGEKEEGVEGEGGGWRVGVGWGVVGEQFCAVSFPVKQVTVHIPVTQNEHIFMQRFCTAQYKLMQYIQPLIQERKIITDSARQCVINGQHKQSTYNQLHLLHQPFIINGHYPQ
jgi:hypothetical protein